MAEQDKIPLDPELDDRKAEFLAQTIRKKKILPSLTTLFLAAFATFLFILLLGILDFTGIKEFHPYLPEQVKKSPWFNDYLVSLRIWRAREAEKNRIDRERMEATFNQRMEQLQKAEKRMNKWQLDLNDERERIRHETETLEKKKTDSEKTAQEGEARLKGERDRLEADKKEFNEKQLAGPLAEMMKNMDPGKMAEAFNTISDDLMIARYLSQLGPEKAAAVTNRMDAEKLARLIKKASGHGISLPGGLARAAN